MTGGDSKQCLKFGTRIARWRCVGHAVLRDVALQVRSSSVEFFFSSRGDFSLGS